MLLAQTATTQSAYIQSYSPVNFSKTNVLPTGPVVTQGADLYIGSTKVRFHIATLTDNACAPSNPDQVVSLLKSRGYNAVRLHHIDRGLREGWWSVSKITSFMDKLYAAGIRVSIDLVSKRGETWMTGVDGYKLDLYENRNNARADLEYYVQNIAPILKHPALYLVCLVNEGATILRNNNSPAGAAAKATSFYQWGAGLARYYGYKGLVTDLPDGAVDTPTFGPVAKNFDVCTIHFYGGHPDVANQRYFQNSWALEGWNWGTSVWYGLTSQRPVIVQEWGCLPFNTYRGANSAFVIAEMANYGFDGEAQFCFASNQAYLDGNYDRIDWYNFSTDRPRLIADLFAAAVNAYGNGKRTSYFWGHATPPESSKYTWATDKVKLVVDGSKATGTVFVSDTQALVFVWNATSIDGFSSTPVGEMFQVLNFGSVTQTSGILNTVDMGSGYKVASVTEVNPWTGDEIATCGVTGSTFKPTTGCGVFRMSYKKSNTTSTFTFTVGKNRK